VNKYSKPPDKPLILPFGPLNSTNLFHIFPRISGRFSKNLLLFSYNYLIRTDSSFCRCIGLNWKICGAYWFKNERGVILWEETRFRDQMEGSKA